MTTIPTLNGQTVTVPDSDGEVVTLRVAKEKHNRAIAKLDGEATDLLIRRLMTVRGGEWLDMLQAHGGQPA